VIEVSDGIYRHEKGRQSIYWRYDPTYKGSSRKEIVHFHDDQGLFEFFVSFMTLFFTWVISSFWETPIELGKNEALHWISIRPAKPI
jgi:hypothetical protein